MIRADLTDIPTYVPGKRIDNATKLSSNEVAFAPLPAAVSAMTDAASTANRYPDMGAIELREVLAELLELEPEQIAVGCGSSALCQQLVQATCRAGDEVIFPWRSFEAYPIFAKVAGAVAVPISLLPETQGHDLHGMIDAITDHTRLIFLCNPNNPSGTTFTEAEFEAFMERVPADVVVGLDEAYFEFNRAEDSPVATEAIQRYPNVVGLRTFSKAYGLAGVRIGYAFGNPVIIDAMNKVAIPFAVSSVAQAAAIASLNSADELLERTEEVVSQRERMARVVGAQQSQANFVWLPGEGAAELAGKLAEQGIVIRAFPEGARITVTNTEDTDKFLAAWDVIHNG